MIGKRQFNEFLELLKYLKPQHFIGLAKLLLVEVLTDEVDENGHHLPRDSQDILNDMVKSFQSQSRPARKQIIKILRNCKEEALKEVSANGTENPEGAEAV